MKNGITFDELYATYIDLKCEQLNKLVEYYEYCIENNARPTRNINGRQVERSLPSQTSPTLDALYITLRKFDPKFDENIFKVRVAQSTEPLVGKMQTLRKKWQAMKPRTESVSLAKYFNR